MHSLLTKKQRQFQQQVRTFANEHVAPYVKQMEMEDRFPHSLIEKMRQAGLMGIPIESKYGGAGLDFTSYIVAIYELSKVSAAVGVILAVHTSVGTKPIVSFGTKEQMQRYALPLASGKKIGAFALTEPNAGSDAASIRMKATLDGKGYRLNGTKLFITNGGVADTYVVFATVDESAGKKGITAFIVEKDRSGLTIGTKERKMGLHGSATTELIFEDVWLPMENRLGEEGEGFRIAMAQLEIGRIGIAAQALGIAEAAFHEGVQYVKTYKQPPTVNEQMIAQMATEIEAAKLLTLRASHLIDRDISCSKEASMAKLFAASTAVKVSSNMLQLLGVEGYTERFCVERYFRDAKVCEIYEGTSEIQRLVISKHMLAKEKE